jgi:catechol 2,3-dioxygenase-like lactoylglutathione lyase family enzyme
MIANLVPELYCRNLAISINFYTEILGFSILFQRPEHGFAYLEREGAQLMLEEPARSDRTWLKAELEYPYGRGVSFQIKTADVEKLYQTVMGAECNIFLPMETKWYRRNEEELGNLQFIVCDPDGFLLRFFQDLGTKPYVR